MVPQEQEQEIHPNLQRSWKYARGHPNEQILGDPSKGVTTRSRVNAISLCDSFAFLSQIEPKSIQEALIDEHWMNAMHEGLNQFERSKVWSPVE